ncbi:FGGY-family carbohydrate kinase [Paenibacillus sacheonensis]|uniref:Carbohydrate kinase n=1 Tax=Paenibacillus sacheonensis TaxID=742054 RepID=A0A7X5BYX5_9BACL|nr:FGGY family carbohydrate kinase [Paenibacillus sacheonensis]MBM7564032.1 sugar (pentulose or hexulose) kinase [Paenibacillus sacheonensis]NBC67635.1 carbohydrate kinase [Paenibacillus sacheonensis]
MLLAIDIGSTNMKAGLFREDGIAVAQAERPNIKTAGPAGTVVYDPERMWETAASLIRDVAAAADRPCVRAVGITSMAESGLLVDPSDGKARSPVMPWFETCSIPQAELVKREIDAKEHFFRTGLHASFKFGLAKLLWLKERFPEAFEGESVWLSASAYIAYRLTGRMAEDETLAARTFVYRIDRREWDAPFICHFGFRPELFPEVVAAGSAVGTVDSALAAELGLSGEPFVCLAGHDHAAASLACSAGGDDVYNSMGTAETLVGAFAERALSEADFASGMSFGRHALPDRMFWMGGHSASGGSVEWLRETIGDGTLSYAAIMKLLSSTGPDPTGILYFPYLSGSGSPRMNQAAKAAFIGLTAKHGKGDLIKAVLEGNAYQVELMRRSAERIGGSPIERMKVVGGGAKNEVWLQIKADVSGAELIVPGTAEATLLGAALSAGVGAGVYGSFREAANAVCCPDGKRYVPDPDRHARYRQCYERGFMALMNPLTDYYESCFN